jgi:type I restriction enzyme S subunit
MNLNKEIWNLNRFDQFVQNISERIEPSESKSDIYVGLEHIDPGKIDISRWDKPEVVKGIKLKFYKGDIIFGKRRAYQRKAGLAKMDGICSAHSMVLRPKDGMTSEFLIFFIHSNTFMQRAVEISEGSLSPTIKWKSLAKQEFLLPPKDDQAKILNLFLSLEKQIEQTEEQEKNQRKLAKKIIDDFIDNKRFGDLLNDENLKEYTWKDCVHKLLRRTDAVSDGIKRIVAGENLQSEDFKIRDWGTVGKDFLGPAFHVMFEPGDILYGSRRTYLRKVSLADFRGVCANTTFVVRAKEDLLLQELLKHIMLSERFTQYSIAKSKGSTNPYINWKDLDGFTFKLPDIETQKKMVEILDGCIDLAEKARTQTATLKKLKHQLLDEILG